MKPELSGYEIGERMGTGDVAVSWLAKQLENGRPVIVEAVLPQLLATDESRDRFTRLASPLLQLNHPGIVRLYDILLKGDQVYCVTARHEGVSLREKINRHGPLTEKQALLVAESVALALRYAYEQTGLVHGCLKPEHLVEDRDGNLRIEDFGIIRFLLAATGNEASARRELLGEVSHYMAPELALGQASDKVMSDVYSLGAILYHAAGGQRPFEDTIGDRTLERHAFDQLADVRDLNPSLSEGFSRLLEKLMRKDPTRRPANWREVLADIAEVRSGGMPLGAKPKAGASTMKLNTLSGPAPRKTGKPEAPARRPVAPVRPPAPTPPRTAQPLPAPGPGATAAPAPGVAGPAGTPTARKIVVRTHAVRHPMPVKSRRSLLVGIVVALVALNVLIIGYSQSPAVREIVDVLLQPARNIKKVLTQGGTSQDSQDNGSWPYEGNPGRIVVTIVTQEAPDSVESPDSLPGAPGTPSAGSTGAVSSAAGQPATTGPAATNRPAGTPTGPAPGTPRPPPRPAGPRKHPLFLAAANEYNSAVDAYERFKTTRDFNLIEQTEKKANAALAQFELYDKAAPGDPNIMDYKQRCYGLIRAARQLILTDGGLDRMSRNSTPRYRSAVERYMAEQQQKSSETNR